MAAPLIFAVDCRLLPQYRVTLHNQCLAPFAANTKGVSCVHLSQSEEDDGIDDMIIQERMVLWRHRSNVHQHEQKGPEIGTQPDGKTECQGETYSKEADHEQPVSPC